MGDALQEPGKRGGNHRKPPQTLDAAAVADATAGVASRYVSLRDPSGRPLSTHAALDTDLVLRYPAIAEYLTQTAVGHATRITSTVLLMADDGVFKVCLSDRETDQVCWASAETWEGVWEALERSLANGSACWRAKRPYTPKKG